MNGEHKTGSGTAPALLKAADAAKVYGVSERKFHELRAKGGGVVPEPVMLGARCLRWVHSELVASAANLPRQAQPAPMPSQLRRRVEELKGGAS